MEATADNLLNQISQVVLDKLDKQNFDPKFLQKFIEALGKNVKYKSTSVIPQASSNDDTTPISGKSDKTLTGQLKKAYIELLDNNTYKEKYTKFIGKVFDKVKLNVNFDDLKLKTPIVDGIDNKAERNTTAEEGRKKLIEDKEKPQKVVLAGFTETASRALKGKFSDIFKGLLDKLKFNFESPKGGIGLITGGLALLLGGLAALVAGLMSDGPFKGLLKILAKTGITGGIKLLEVGAKIFMAGLKAVIQAPIRILQTAANAIGKVFGKKAIQAVMKPIGAMTGIVTKITTSIGRVLATVAKRIPILGAIISFGFAASRFKSGDTVGGIIDVLSGLSNILMLAGPIGFGVGLTLGLGLDALNAFLDYKTGGASPETSKKKGSILTDWLKGVRGFIYKNLLKMPIIGPFIKAFEEFAAGNYLKGFKQLAYTAPVLEILGGLLGDTEAQTVAGESGLAGKDILSNLWKWMKDTLWEKVKSVMGSLIDNVKSWWKNIDWKKPSTWFGDESTLPETVNEQNEKTSDVDSSNNTETVSSKRRPRRNKPMAEGGIVTEPIEAMVGEAGPEAIIPLKTGGIVTQSTIANVGEAGPEAVIPLEKYFNGKDFGLSNDTLNNIAYNTKETNSSLKILGEAIFSLVTVLDKKLTINNNTGGSTVIGVPQNSQIPSAAQVASSNADIISNVRQQFRQMQFA